MAEFLVTPQSMSASTAEARWFVAGRLPEALVPPRPPLRRCDEYDLSRLAPDRSVKRRGGRHIESKLRIGRVQLVEIGGVTGFAERWLKARVLEDERWAHHAWLAVRKQVWRRRGLQVCAIDVEGEEWWSVAVSVPGVEAELLAPWRGALLERGQPSAYPDWLMGLARRRA